MHTILPRIQRPELFFGFVSPIGTDVSGCMHEFKVALEAFGYIVVEISVTEFFKRSESVVIPEIPIDNSNEYTRYKTYISYGNQLRSHFKDDAVLARMCIAEISNQRDSVAATHNNLPPSTQTAYLIRQFKRREEVDLLRATYGRLFFQISLYSRRGARVDYLARKFASSDNRSNPQQYRDKAESLVQIDERQSGTEHGQDVGKLFHHAELIISLDADQTISLQIKRFCELLFGSNSISPTKIEYGMYSAKAAALRTLDLSRQVGAAIFTNKMEIIALGSNEVPKAFGGTYWCDDQFDDREYVHGEDSNDRRKKEILTEIITAIEPESPLEELFKRDSVKDSQFMDALEYGRIVHAEMSAITDAARLGRTTKDATLFCTTFPCHMCAKHIVSAGINNVYFLEPYPKSLAYDLHSDSIDIEGGDRGAYSARPGVRFTHFYGVTPRRYRELFERSSRKKNGLFERYINSNPMPNIDMKFPFYHEIEKTIFERSSDILGIIDPHTTNGEK